MFTETASFRKRQLGLSLIELIMFIIIVSVALVGILSVMNVTVKSSADPMLRKQAVAMAEAILDEILAKDYVNPTPGGYTETAPTCANRLLYDDVDDYACFTGPPFILGTSTLGATSLNTPFNYSATVTVAPPTAINGAFMKKITVTVTGGGETIHLFGYRAGY
jgi:MSHA pilin protein MshD